LFFIYIYFFDTTVALWVTFLVFAALTNLSITAGYHRLFAHRSYETNTVMKFFLLFFGSSAFQGPALKWASDHRRHHSHIDTEKDPYSIKKGFWYAHIGWLFFKDSVDLDIKAPDLEKDRLLQHQQKHYLLWSITAGFLFPILIGFAFGAPIGGLIILGSLRIFITQQSTFFVNSLCHTLGEQTYSKEISARDSFFVAVLTHGEGYHNFHHEFQLDYRNGIKWYHWDPTKWTIQLMNLFGLARKLRTIPAQEILKAKLNSEAQWLQAKGISAEKVEALKARILETQIRVKNFKEEYAQMKLAWKNSSQEKWNELQIQVAEMKLNIQRAKAEFNFALKEWQLYTQFALN
jgi:stearoyl-CoA desaturase (delta-9 desaturase)